MIKVGIIGAGAIAQRTYIPSYQKNEEVKIIGICDSNEDKGGQGKNRGQKVRNQKLFCSL